LPWRIQAHRGNNHLAYEGKHTKSKGSQKSIFAHYYLIDEFLADWEYLKP
jgi:hypothetical protein